MSFDAISKNKRKDKQDEKVVLLGKHAQSRGKVYVKLDGDVFTPWITGCAVMPNGIVAICDYYNDRLKLFDNFWVCKGSFAIPDIWSISVADSNSYSYSSRSEENTIRTNTATSTAWTYYPTGL